jgi:uncharacterized protein (DUF1697 family)
VGKAKRIAMADLRRLLEGLGHTGVSTVLMSGNAVFTSSERSGPKIAKAIEAAIQAQLQLEVRVLVWTATAVRKVVDANPFADEGAKQPSRLGIAFLESAPDKTQLQPIVDRDWSPEAFAIGDKVLYTWQPDGITGSPLGEALLKLKGGPVQTVRNLATVQKILDRAESLG